MLPSPSGRAPASPSRKRRPKSASSQATEEIVKAAPKTSLQPRDARSHRRPAEPPPLRLLPPTTMSGIGGRTGLLGLALPSVSRNEQIALCRLAKAGDATAHERLLLANIPFLTKVARRYARTCRHLDIEDLMQEGTKGIEHAIRKFDEKRGVTFLTYAGNWIRHYMMRARCDFDDEVRVPTNVIELARSAAFRDGWAALEDAGIDYDKAVRQLARELRVGVERIERALACTRNRHTIPIDAPMTSLAAQGHGSNGEITLHSLLPCEDPSPDEQVGRSRLTAEVRAKIDRLRQHMDPVDQALVDRRLAVDERDEETLEEIGARFGVSRERIRQREREVIQFLSAKLREFRPGMRRNPTDEAPRQKALAPVPPRESVGAQIDRLRRHMEPIHEAIVDRRLMVRARQRATLKAIGESFGMTRERVRQCEVEIVQYLSRRIPNFRPFDEVKPRAVGPPSERR